MTQPEWQTIYCTDYSKLEVDATGVYPAELTIADPFDDDEEDPKWLVFRIVLERCTYEKGVLSDNPSHPEVPAWFARDLAAVAQSNSTTWAELVTALCSLDPRERAWAYEQIGCYHGYEALDEEPLTENEEELLERLS